MSVAGNRQYRVGGDSAADIHEGPDEVDVEALPRMKGPGDVHVVIGVRVGRIGMQPEHDRTNGHGKRKQSEGNTHGMAA